MTFLFCDLNNFTRFTSRHGDLAAARIAGEFAEVVRANAGTYGYLVKELGDGALLAYSEPISAVRAWTDIVAAAREQSLPPLRGAIHRGRAVFRSGDYFGTAVNLVARLVGRAPRGELFATKAVVEATSDQFGWRVRGARRVPGIRGTVALYSLLQPEVTRDR